MTVSAHALHQRKYAATLKGKLCERNKTMRRAVRRRAARIETSEAVLSSPEALLDYVNQGDLT